MATAFWTRARSRRTPRQVICRGGRAQGPSHRVDLFKCEERHDSPFIISRGTGSKSPEHREDHAFFGPESGPRNLQAQDVELLA
jgi:hypothetical protein